MSEEQRGERMNGRREREKSRKVHKKKKRGRNILGPLKGCVGVSWCRTGKEGNGLQETWKEKKEVKEQS